MAKKKECEVNESNYKDACVALLQGADMVNYEMTETDREAPYNMKSFKAKVIRMYKEKDFLGIDRESKRQIRLMRSCLFDY